MASELQVQSSLESQTGQTTAKANTCLSRFALDSPPVLLIRVL